MPVTNVKKQGVITGVSELYISVQTTEETGTTPPVYDTVIYKIPIIKEVTVSVPQEDTIFYASNGVYDSGTFITEAELSVTTMKLDTKIFNKVLGLIESPDGASVVRAGTVRRPWVAVGFASTTHNGAKQAYWFPKTKWAIPEVSASTQEDTQSEQTTEFTIMAYPLNNATRDLYFSADSEVEDSNVDFDKFFDTVPTNLLSIPTL